MGTTRCMVHNGTNQWAPNQIRSKVLLQDPEWLTTQRLHRSHQHEKKRMAPPLYVWNHTTSKAPGSAPSSKAVFPRTLSGGLPGTPSGGPLSSASLQRAQSSGSLPKFGTGLRGHFSQGLRGSEIDVLPGSFFSSSSSKDDDKDDEFEQYREGMVRQSTLVRTRVTYRQSLGWAARLPPPCDDVYMSLTENMRPDPVELLQRMNSGENFRSAMALMLLTQFPKHPEMTTPPVFKPQNLSGLDLFLQKFGGTTAALDVRKWAIWVRKIAQPWRPKDQRKSGTEETPEKMSGWARLRKAILEEDADDDDDDDEDVSKQAHKQFLAVKKDLALDPRMVGAAVLVFPAATSVSLARVGVTDVALSLVHCWSRLRDLDLSKNAGLTGEHLAGLKNLPRLSSITVSGCPLLDTLEHLQAIQSLEHVIALDCMGIVSIDEPHVSIQIDPSPTDRDEQPKFVKKRREKGDAPVVTGEMLTKAWLAETDPKRMKSRRDSSEVGYQPLNPQLGARLFGADKPQWRRPALLGSHSVSFLDVHGCQNLKILKVKLPRITDLDVQYMHGLKGLEGSMRGLLRLNLSNCSGLEVISRDLWIACPNLEDFTAADVPNLRSILGLTEALMLKHLRVPRCANLRELQVPTPPPIIKPTKDEEDEDSDSDQEIYDHGACPRLLYADFHGCDALPDNELWQFIRCRLHPGYFEHLDHDEGVASSFSTSECLGEVQKVMMRRVGSLGEGDIATVIDFWFQEDEEGREQMMYHLRSLETVTVTDAGSTGMRRGAIRNDQQKRYRGCHIEASEDGLSIENKDIENAEKGTLVVWPNRDRALAFPPLQKIEMQRMLQEGLRSKLHKAIVACKKEASKSARNLPAEMLRKTIRADLVDAIQRADGRIKDLPLMRSLFRRGVVKDLAPEVQILCLFGCGKTMPAKEYLDHEKVCDMRRDKHALKILIPFIGGKPKEMERPCGVRHDLAEHFDAVCAELDEAMGTWNPDKLRDAITAVCGPSHRFFSRKKCKCEGCILPPDIVHEADLRCHRLEEKYRHVLPICKKGHVSVDFDACAVHVQVPIVFANRKPPDTSAALEQSKEDESMETINDLAEVLKAYGERMVIEGHTGQTSPPEYWGKLADNRSILVTDILEKRLGVPEGLCVPRGCPGGGAKVLVYPAEKKKPKKERKSTTTDLKVLDGNPST